MLKSTALCALEQTINFVLARDPESNTRLQVLVGKTILLASTEPTFNMYWLFEANKILLRSEWRDEVNASISSPLNELIQLGLSDKKIAKDLTVKGDLQLIEAFKQLFSQLDIDWDEYFSQYTGDVVAHHIGQAARKARSFLKHALSSLSGSTTEYLQEEINVLPAKAAVTDFAAEVRELDRDVERLAARIKRLRS
jgi:ubiquinone biosynthesis protein UbiJ